MQYTFTKLLGHYQSSDSSDQFHASHRQLGRWIIRQVTKHLDYAAATKPEGCIVKEMDGTPPPSGHTLQAQFAMIANSLYGHVEGLTDRDLASPSQVTRTTYKLVWEARSGRAKNHLDLLIRNGHSVRLGFELWIGRELEVLAERVKRAHQYAVQHDCRVWVVNFCLNDCEQPKKQLSLPKILFESKVAAIRTNGISKFPSYPCPISPALYCSLHPAMLEGLSHRKHAEIRQV